LDDDLDRDVSNKRDFYKHKLKKLSQTKEINKINIVKDYGVCFVIVERLVKRLIAFSFEKDRCFVFQTLGFRLQSLPLFIEVRWLLPTLKNQLALL